MNVSAGERKLHPVIPTNVWWRHLFERLPATCFYLSLTYDKPDPSASNNSPKGNDPELSDKTSAGKRSVSSACADWLIAGCHSNLKSVARLLCLSEMLQHVQERTYIHYPALCLCLSVCLCLYASVSLPHTHTHARMHARTHTHTDTHTHTHTHTDFLSVGQNKKITSDVNLCTPSII